MPKLKYNGIEYGNIVKEDSSVIAISRNEFDSLRWSERFDSNKTYLITDERTMFSNGVEIPLTNDVEYQQDMKAVHSNLQILAEELERMDNLMKNKVTFIHNCQCCGASLNLKENKPIINCKYCGSTYIIGTERLFSRY